MITSMRKYLLLGAQEDLDLFFERAQEKGIMEFIRPVERKAEEVPLEIKHLVQAIKILRKLPEKPLYEGPVEPGLAMETARRVIALRAEVEKLTEEQRVLEVELARVSPFGDFSIEDLDYIRQNGSLEIRFFCRRTSHALPLPPGCISIASDHDLDYFVSIDQGAVSYPKMIEMRIDRPLGELTAHLHFVRESLHQIEAELKGFVGHSELLQEALVGELNLHHLLVAKKSVGKLVGELEDSFFFVEAWIPENKVSGLYAIIGGMAIHAEPILIEKKDRIPTCIQNRNLARIGEDLVRIYDIPAHGDKDPSLPVLLFFALFFAMIVADAGYGLIYLAIFFYLKYRCRRSSSSVKRMVKLFGLLSGACIVWGVLTASFFGIQIPPESGLAKNSLVGVLAYQKAAYHMQAHDGVFHSWVTRFPALADVTSPGAFLTGGAIQRDQITIYEMWDTFSENILQEFSILLGMIHIGYSLLRYFSRHWAGLGWILFLIGGYLYFPSLLGATSLLQFIHVVDSATAASIGLQLIYTGMALAVVLALIQKRLQGLAEISHVMQLLGDVLSYLRLYALGLAGAMMAETFNKMAVSVWDHSGFLLAFFVILFGHGLNISIGVVAGVIHGLRLNFIEWYHYCFEGSGRLFKPLTQLKFKE